MITLPTDRPILLVDDDDIERTIVARVLSRSHLRNELVALGSGEEAVSYMEEVAAGSTVAPSLILLDINMPGITGFAVLEQLRSQEAFARTPIVAMLSSSDARDDRERAQALGADCYIAKPTGLEAYVATMNGTFANSCS